MALMDAARDMIPSLEYMGFRLAPISAALREDLDHVYETPVEESDSGAVPSVMEIVLEYVLALKRSARQTSLQQFNMRVR